MKTVHFCCYILSYCVFDTLFKMKLNILSPCTFHINVGWFKTLLNCNKQQDRMFFFSSVRLSVVFANENHFLYRKLKLKMSFPHKKILLKYHQRRSVFFVLFLWWFMNRFLGPGRLIIFLCYGIWIQNSCITLTVSVHCNDKKSKAVHRELDNR